MSDLHREIKLLIIDALGLEDISADDIGDNQTLFGEGLGLDSVDALELGLAIQKKYGIKIDADANETGPCKLVTIFSTPCAMPWSSCSNWIRLA